MVLETLDRRTGRINYIDFLKFIGLTGIIIAHVGSPGWALMLRSFDIPLMVILSAILADRSYEKHEANNQSVKIYYISRIKRLVIPTWIFLIGYFALYFLMGGQYQGIKYYIASFCLTRYGIGYVWIILVYLYSAMLIPLFSKMQLSVKGLILVITAYILYEIAYFFEIGTQNKFLETTIYYIIPYGLLTYLGYNYYKMKTNTKRIIALTSFIVFAVLAIYYWAATGSPQLVQIAKYPPRLYYLSYGIACTFGLLLLCEKHCFKIYDNRIIRYVSMHSMWIYLWHIPVLKAYSALRLPQIWYIKLLIVYAVSVLIVFGVNKCLDIIEKKHKFAFFRYLRG